MSVFRKGWFHKKGLGFASQGAANLVKAEDVLQCKSRFFVLLNPNDNQPWQLRYFKFKLDKEDDYAVPLSEVGSNPGHALKGCFILDESTSVTLANGVMSLSTRERTLLVTVGESDEDILLLHEWFSTIDSYVTSRKQVMATTEAMAERRKSMVQQAESSSSGSNLPFRRISILQSPQSPSPATSPQPVNPSPPSQAAPVEAPNREGVARQPSARVVSINAQATGNDDDSTQQDEMSLESILANVDTRKKFRAFIKSAFASENLDFYEAVESHMAIPETDVQALRRSAAGIAEKFVGDAAEFQVNLSYAQSRSLLNSLRASASSNDNNNESEGAGEMTLCLLQSQHEILELMRRNFFHRFSAVLRQEEERQALLRSGTGCFTSLYQRAGVDAVSILLKQLKAMQDDNRTLLVFLQKRYAVGKAYVSGSLNSCAEEFRSAQVAGKLFPSASTALRSTFDTFDIHARNVNEYLDEMREVSFFVVRLM